jgi:aldehyde dehydrogenase (NAD+)
MAKKPTVYKNYINGAWVASKTGKTFVNVNPADKNDVIGHFQDSDARDVDAAVAAAKAAFKKWRLVPAPKRAELVMELGLWLKKNKEKLANDATREMGKVLKETRGDVQEGIDMALFCAGEGRRMYGMTTPCELPNKFGMTVREPLGVCGLITPWNFPMAIPTWKMMPALVCGNTVVIKPASLTPLTVWNLVKGAEAVGFPPGVINYVTGGGRGVGTPLCTHKDVALISFTGSTEVGRQINLACASDFKRVGLEMGGKNAVIVMDDADLDLAIEGVLWGAFGTTGQRCTATSRCLVQRGVYDKFVETLAKRAKASRWGTARRAWTWTRRGRVSSYRSVVRRSPRKRARASSRQQRLSGLNTERILRGPTIFADVTPKMPSSRRRSSGPSGCGALCLRGGRGHAERLPLRPEHHLHPGREQGLRGHARRPNGPLLRERPHHRRREPPALRRHEADGQRPPRGRQGSARPVLRVESHLRGLLRPASEGADRHRQDRQGEVIGLTR